MSKEWVNYRESDYETKIYIKWYIEEIKTNIKYHTKLFSVVVIDFFFFGKNIWTDVIWANNIELWELKIPDQNKDVFYKIGCVKVFKKYLQKKQQ